jgi:predicted nucleic acid-binding protein
MRTALGRELAQVGAFSDRVWQLHANLTVYDSWYVGLAVWLATDLAAADGRLATPAARAVRRR